MKKALLITAVLACVAVAVYYQAEVLQDFAYFVRHTPELITWLTT